MRSLSTLLGALLALMAMPAAAADLFRAGPGVGGIQRGATGIYELGTITFANTSVGLRALLQNGQVLQVQSHHDGRWLARRSGSAGGKTIAPTSFDALTAITGGVNVDVRQLQPAKRQQFAATAGMIVLEAAPGDARLQQAGPQAASAAAGSAVAQCAGTACRVHFSRSGSDAGFTIELDDDASTWSFTGFGIVAIWPVPQPSAPR